MTPLKRFLLCAVWIVSAAYAFKMGNLLTVGEVGGTVKEKNPVRDSIRFAQSGVMTAGNEIPVRSKADEKRSSLLDRMRTALADPVTVTRLEAWLRCIDEAGPGELTAAGELIEAGKERWAGTEREFLVTRWVSSDPGGYVIFCQTHPTARGAGYAGYAANLWARNDTAAARTFLIQETEKLDGGTRRELVRGLASWDISWASEQMLEGKDTGWREMSAIEGIVAAVWESNSAAATARWLESVTNRSENDVHLAGALHRETLKEMPQEILADAAGAARILQKWRMHASWDKDDAEFILRKIVADRSEPEKAWRIVLEAGPDPTTGVLDDLGVMKLWSEYHTDSFEKWLAGQTESPFYKKGAEAYVRARKRLEPEKARKWAAGIDDEVLRGRLGEVLKEEDK